MQGPSSWWRGAGVVLASLVLALLTFGPALDSLTCQDEAGSAAAAEMAVVAHDAAHAMGGDASPPCPHGHCHHGVAYVAPPAVREALRLADREDPRPPPGRVRALDRQFELIRPPRA